MATSSFIFSRNTARKFYNLEQLWADAEITKIDINGIIQLNLFKKPDRMAEKEKK